jgi:lipoprotein-anchoring transpeptidase ErfK/SrfK
MKSTKVSLLGAILLIFAIGLSGCVSDQNAKKKEASSNHTETKSSTTTANNISSKSNEKLVKAKPIKTASINWNAPSGGPYPKLKPHEPIWIDVSINDQKVYIKDKQKVLYTMITSSGLDTTPDNSTPKGTYHIQAERGTWFYSPQYKEGAEYWVSWKNHGEFLFHSVPMTQDKKVLIADAKKLGQKDSHGCFHLTIPDAKWIYTNIPFGTKVVVRS